MDAERSSIEEVRAVVLAAMNVVSQVLGCEPSVDAYEALVEVEADALRAKVLLQQARGWLGCTEHFLFDDGCPDDCEQSNLIERIDQYLAATERVTETSTMDAGAVSAAVNLATNGYRVVIGTDGHIESAEKVGT